MDQEVPTTTTSAKLNQFLEETQIPLEMSARSLSPEISAQSSPIFTGKAHSASTPKVNISDSSAGRQVSDEDTANSTGQTAAHNKSYKSRLQYVPSTSFVGEMTSFNGASAPNTFKHKSHPNAKTKSHIMLSSVEEKLSTAMEGESEKGLLSRGAFLTDLSHNQTSEHNDVKDILPTFLDESWKESSFNSKDKLQNDHLGPLAFLASGADTLVHKKSLDEPVPTADWKKAQKESERGRVGRPLEHIFTSDPDANPRSGASRPAYELSSSISDSSSEFLSRNSNQFQKPLDSIGNLPPQTVNVSDSQRAQAKSPLKLYGNAYNTFTKGFLHGVVLASGQKLADLGQSRGESSNTALQAHGEELAEADDLYQKMRQNGVVKKQALDQFKRTGLVSNHSKPIADRSEGDFLEDANDLFQNIRTRGPGFVPKPSRQFHDTIPNETAILSETEDVSTAQPNDKYVNNNVKKAGRGKQYEFASTDSSALEFDTITPNSIVPGQEAISIDRSFEAHSVDSDHAFTEISSNTSSRVNEQTQETQELHDASYSRSDSGEHSQFLSYEIPIPSHYKSPVTPNIRYKDPKNLRLSLNLFSNSSPRSRAVLKGTVKPGDYPERYGAMNLDRKSNKWDYDDKENQSQESLDGLEGLQSLKVPMHGASILKPINGKPKKSHRRAEVSFVSSGSNDNTFEDDSDESSATYDITRVSDINDLSFSRTDRNLVGVITGATSNTDWENLTQIDLSGQELEQVSRLASYLPSLRRLSLARNHIRHLEGLSKSLYELDVSDNELSELASFKNFRDLQYLTARSNHLESLSCLLHNFNLTKLDLIGNSIGSLKGIGLLSNLVSLNLKQNSLKGTIDFSVYDLPKLQELNLEANQISTIQGLEHCPELRIINLAKNNVENFSSEGQLLKTKKLILSFNKLARLDLTPFPNLRVLRIDGNSLQEVRGMTKMHYLQEVSAKFQKQLSVTQSILENATDIVKLDLSGNRQFAQGFFRPDQKQIYPNVNDLSLGALNLTKVPKELPRIFPNLRILRLEFNRIQDTLSLTDFKNLRKVYLLNNGISKIKPLLSSLRNSKHSLNVIDLKLNPLTMECYPDVISSNSSKQMQDIFGTLSSEHLLVNDLEDYVDASRLIEQSKSEWQAKDEDFSRFLKSSNQLERYNAKVKYEALLIQYFPNLQELDGIPITELKCRAARKVAQEVTRNLLSN